MMGVISAIISACTAILVVLLYHLLSGSKILKRLKNMFGIHRRQDYDHNKLLEETRNLKFDSKNILSLSKKLNGKIETIDRTCFTEKENKKIKYDSLSDKQRELKNSIDTLTGFADELEKVTLQNLRLWRENEDLKKENEELKRIIRMQKIRITELKKDDEYEM